METRASVRALPARTTLCSCEQLMTLLWETQTVGNSPEWDFSELSRFECEYNNVWTECERRVE